jgi:hypothetical protein
MPENHINLLLLFDMTISGVLKIDFIFINSCVGFSMLTSMLPVDDGFVEDGRQR